jgi:hypothetical protein
MPIVTPRTHPTPGIGFAKRDATPLGLAQMSVMPVSISTILFVLVTELLTGTVALRYTQGFPWAAILQEHAV